MDILNKDFVKQTKERVIKIVEDSFSYRTHHIINSIRLAPRNKRYNLEKQLEKLVKMRNDVIKNIMKEFDEWENEYDKSM